MHAAKLNQVANDLHVAGQSAAGSTDHQLLLKYRTRGDHVAFAELVGRHGPMVLRVCQRVLRHDQDAEDAFQATFLVLARKAGSVRKTEALASWLHGVAHRVSLRARRDAARRRSRDRETQPTRAKSGIGEADWREVQAALDEEIRALPEKYRAPFVLCILEGKSRAEAAGELGLKEGTVWSRLSQARKLLQERLGHRGIALSAILAVEALSGGTVHATLARLVDSTVRVVLSAGGVPLRTAALARAVGGTMPTKTVIAVLLGLVTIGLLAFGGILLKADGPAPRPEGRAEPKHAGTAQPVPGTRKPSPVTDPDDPKSAGSFSGRVNGPDGKPLAGAKVFIVPYYGEKKEAGPVRATTDADGRFAFDAPDMTYTSQDGLPARREGIVIVTRDGFAPDWFHTWGADHEGLREYWDPVKGAEVNLQLAKDDVPIHGRFLDPNGRPLAGARVRLKELMIPRDRDLTAHLDHWSKASVASGFLTKVPDYQCELYRPDLIPGLTVETRSDAEGRFTLSGLGCDRLAVLSVSAPRVVDTTLEVMTRDGPDVGTFIDSDNKPTQVIHGAGFTLKLDPGRTIKGRVIDRATREPIPGMRVGPQQDARTAVSASSYPWVTDEKGRFTITGLYPSKEKPVITAVAAPGTPYQTASVEVEGDAEVVVECARGLPFHLKVVDEQGKPVEAEVTYVDVQPNADVIHDEAHWPVSHAGRRADGTYEGFVLPGPGAVLVAVGRSGYRPACVDPKAFFAPGRTNWTPGEWKSAYGTRNMLTTSNGRYRGTTYRGSLLYQDDYEAIVLVNPPANSGPLDLAATVLRDKPRQVSLIDPDGKPVKGAVMLFSNGAGPALRDASFPLIRLHPDRLSRRTFIQEDRKLIAYLEARGDADTPYIVRMQPWAKVTGRILDERGNPLKGAGITVVGEKSWDQTKADGRFELDRLVPGKSYSGEIFRDGFQSKVTGMAFERLIPKPGEIRDLGDIRIKPPDQDK
jgi:RNA polymerase sigma factor (sigma-70 family)